MSTTVDARTRVVARLRREPEFAMAMMAEALELMVDGHAEESRSILRMLANAVGFEQLSIATGTHAKTLHRQLSSNGNPTMNAIAQIFHALRTEMIQKPLRVRFQLEAAGAA